MTEEKKKTTKKKEKLVETLKEISTSEDNTKRVEKLPEEKIKLDSPEKEEKKKITKKKEKPKIKKYEATAGTLSAPISTKHSMFICKFIKNKEIDQSINELNEVLAFKRAIPYTGEIPHRKGKGIMSGRYPIKATKVFINILKALKGNSIVNGLELEKTKIFVATASKAARPMRSGGRLAKRTNITLIARETTPIGGKK